MSPEGDPRKCRWQRVGEVFLSKACEEVPCACDEIAKREEEGVVF